MYLISVMLLSRHDVGRNALYMQVRPHLVALGAPYSEKASSDKLWLRACVTDDGEEGDDGPKQLSSPLACHMHVARVLCMIYVIEREREESDNSCLTRARV